DPDRGGREAAFRAARRHSRLVRSLRLVLPAVAIAVAGLFLATMRFTPSDLARIALQGAIDPAGNSIVMDNPQISGFEGTRRAYEVKAESAKQSLDDPKVMTFKTIDARVGLESSGSAVIDADTAIYDGNDDTLLLKDGIAIRTTTGYWASFREAAIDLRKGSLVSSQPIEIRTSEGTIRANAVEVREHGRRIAFRNGVSVIYLPPGELAAAGR
ncbi:MAG: LPS export ABC transporter periplasmic protein LptC, partial [Bauldia sp.]